MVGGFKVHVKSLWDEFVTKMTGIASLILTVLGVFLSLSGDTFAWMFWVAAAVCLVVCSFLVWRKDY